MPHRQVKTATGPFLTTRISKENKNRGREK